MVDVVDRKKNLDLNKVLSSEISSRDSEKRLERTKGLEKCVFENRVKLRLLDMIIKLLDYNNESVEKMLQIKSSF